MDTLSFDLLLIIASYLPTPHDVRALRNTHPSLALHRPLTSIYYRSVVNGSSNTPLCWAAVHGSMTIARLALKKGPEGGGDVNSTTVTREPVVLSAAKGNHEDIVDLLLSQPDQPCRLDAVDRYRNTALIWAARRGYGGIVRRLLERGGCGVGMRNEDGESALWWAARRGYAGIVGMLLEYSEREGEKDDETAGDETVLEHRDHKGTSALSITVRYGHEETARMLVASGRVSVPQRWKKNNAKASLLLQAVWSGRISVVEFVMGLEEAIEHVDGPDLRGRTPLSYAASGGYEAIVKLLLATGKVNAESRDMNRNTPLDYAVQRGHAGVVGMLLDHITSDIYTKGDGVRILAIRAAEYGRVELLHSLLHRADSIAPAATSDAGPMPGVSALYTSDEDLLWKTTLQGPTARTKLFITEPTTQQIFWTAASNGQLAVIKSLLLHRGGEFSVDRKGYDGRTAFSRAVCTDNMDLVRFLFNHTDVDADAHDHGGYTPLYWAVRWRRPDSVRFLLERGVSDPYERLTDYGDCAWREAHRRGCKDMVDLISEFCPCPADYKGVVPRLGYKQ